ncbi:MAG: deoxyribonuclease IV [Fimbriimonadaceae bacterium]|nr:deoxyribonuclease IV [Fimbriimonadaceae bacterium]
MSTGRAKWIGAHMPTKDGLGGAIRNGAAIGCTAVQVFTNSPQTWRAKPITPAMVEDFRAAREETGITHVVSHDSYLVNLCANDPAKLENSIRGLIAEVTRCATYGITKVVSHMGAHLGAGADVAIPVVAESARQVLAETDPSVMILMETTAGQGSSLNANFEELARMRDAIDSPRIGVCLDTCHIFAAGYDIRTADGFTEVIDRFDAVIGLAALQAIHVNDSLKPFGSRLDRHAHLGEGEIGPAAFRALVQDARLAEIPMMVETPDADTDHARNVATLWAFAREA